VIAAAPTPAIALALNGIYTLIEAVVGFTRGIYE
jgi:hypothetical protein